MINRQKNIAKIIAVTLSTSIILASNPMVTFAETTKITSESNQVTSIKDMPSNLKSAVEWIWTNRIDKEKSTERQNTIFDQIFAGKGTLNYVVRWQSTKSISLQERQNLEKALNISINSWTQCLKGYDGWPFDEIKVKIVGWAVIDEASIKDKQADEIVYTDSIADDLSKTDTSIPSVLPVAPSEISRFDHFYDKNYSYPGGMDKRFDMYLWGTTSMQGGAGGDWGQRVSDDYILQMANGLGSHIVDHEIGHGFGLTDFYEESDRPPGGFPVNTIMWAGDSISITEMDEWMLRYTWSKIKGDSERFKIESSESKDENETKNDAEQKNETESKDKNESGNTSNDSDNQDKNETNSGIQAGIQSEIQDGEIYYIKNLNSQLYLNVEDGKYKNGVNVNQAEGNGSDAQKFKVVSVEDGYYKLVSQVGDKDKIVTLSKKKATDGVNVEINKDKKAKNQYFKLINSDTGIYEIATKVSKDSSRLEVSNFSTEEGGNVVQWSSTSNTNQQWIFELAK